MKTLRFTGNKTELLTYLDYLVCRDCGGAGEVVERLLEDKNIKICIHCEGTGYQEE